MKEPRLPLCRTKNRALNRVMRRPSLIVFLGGLFLAQLMGFSQQYSSKNLHMLGFVSSFLPANPHGSKEYPVTSCGKLGANIWRSTDINLGLGKGESRYLYCQPLGEDHVEIQFSCDKDVIIRLDYISPDKSITVPKSKTTDVFVNRTIKTFRGLPGPGNHSIYSSDNEQVYGLRPYENEVVIKFPDENFRPAGFHLTYQQLFAADVISFDLPLNNTDSKVHLSFHPQDPEFTKFASKCFGYKKRTEPEIVDDMPAAKQSDVTKQEIQRVSAGVATAHLKKSTPPVGTVDLPSGSSAVVVVNVTINPEGHVTSAIVDRIDGRLGGKQWIAPAALGDIAVSAVRSWEYTPFLTNGKAVTITTSVNVRFP